MKILCNAHTHTKFCDGKNTVDEMVLRALELGFTDLGFSEHSYAPFDKGFPGMRNAEGYRQAVADAKQKFKGKINLLCGIEQDFNSEQPLKGTYDYILGSVHYLSCDGTLLAVDSPNFLLSQIVNEYYNGDGLAMVSAYYARVIENVSTNHPDIVGHFDVIVKHNGDNDIFDENSTKYKNNALEAADAVANEVLKYGGIVEVNTGGTARGYRSFPYPAPLILRHLAQKGVRVMINSDSHGVKAMNYGFDFALGHMYSAGFDCLTILNKGKFVDVKLT